MSEQPLRPGDRVRVTPRAFEGVVTDDSLKDVVQVHEQRGSGDWYHTVEPIEDYFIEVLERADDPSNDPIWTVRTVEPAPEMSDGNTVVKFGDSYWLYPSKLGNGYGRLDWAKVRDSEVVGVVPGTQPADPEVIDASTLFPPPAGNAPRIFRSDGPEPPEDVRAVRAVGHEGYPCPYFVRFAEGWSCSSTPTVTEDQRSVPVPWLRTQYYGIGSEFREVLR